MIVLQQGGEWLWQKVPNIPISLKRMRYSIAWIIQNYTSQVYEESWNQQIRTKKLAESSKGT